MIDTRIKAALVQKKKTLRFGFTMKRLHFIGNITCIQKMFLKFKAAHGNV